MALMDFIKKQFIDIIQWTEDGDGTLAWRFPMEDMEIQNGASLTVRESQMAVFVNEGKVADVFGPGMLQADDADAAGPDLPEELGQAVRVARSRATSTSSARASRSTSAGARRSRSRSATRTSAPCACAPSATTATASPTRACSTPRSRARASVYTVAELDGQLRGLMLQHISRRRRAERHRRSSTSPPTRSSSPSALQEATRAGVRQARPEAREA